MYKSTVALIGACTLFSAQVFAAKQSFNYTKPPMKLNS